MREPWQTILRVAVVLGIAMFLWSVLSSQEMIAKALGHLAYAEDARGAALSTEDRPPTEGTS